MKYDEINLHCRSVQEAMEKVQSQLEWMISHEELQALVFIHGKGLHSAHGQSRIRTAVRRFFEEKLVLLDENQLRYVRGEDQFPITESYDESVTLLVRKGCEEESLVNDSRQIERKKVVFTQEGKEERQYNKKHRKRKRIKKAQLTLSELQFQHNERKYAIENDSFEDFDELKHELSEKDYDVSILYYLNKQGSIDWNCAKEELLRKIESFNGSVDTFEKVFKVLDLTEDSEIKGKFYFKKYKQTKCQQYLMKSYLTGYSDAVELVSKIAVSFEQEGYRYLNELTKVIRHKSIAFRYFTDALILGCHEARDPLFDLYKEGYGFACDFKSAYDWFEKHENHSNEFKEKQAQLIEKKYKEGNQGPFDRTLF